MVALITPLAYHGAALARGLDLGLGWCVCTARVAEFVEWWWEQCSVQAAIGNQKSIRTDLR